MLNQNNLGQLNISQHVLCKLYNIRSLITVISQVGVPCIKLSLGVVKESQYVVYVRPLKEYS